MMAALATGCGGGGGGSAAQSSSNLKLRIELPRDANSTGGSYTYNALINVTSYDATGAPTTVASTTSTLAYNETTEKMTGTFFISQIPVGSNYIVAAHVSSSDSQGAIRVAGQTSSTFAHVGAVVDTISDGVTADVAVNTASTIKALALMYYAQSNGAALSNTSVITSAVKTAIGTKVDAMLTANPEIGYQFTSDYYTNGDPFDPANWTEQLETNLAGIISEAGLAPRALGIIPPNGALNVPYDETVFGIVFNRSMDTKVNLNDNATLQAAAFSVTITGGQYPVTIDRTNAMYYGMFSWTTTTVPNDTLSFTLFPTETLISNEVYPLVPETTFGISLIVPSNLLTSGGEPMPVPASPFTGTFTTMPEVDNRVYDNARLTGQYVGMSICPGGSQGYTWFDTQKYLIVSNGDGTGTWESLAESHVDPEDETTGTFTYYVLADGTLMIVDSNPEESDPYLYGTITSDGNIVVNSEYELIEGSSNCLDVVVKKGTGMTMSAAAGSYIINEYGAEVGQSLMPRIAAVTGTCSDYTTMQDCELASGCYWDGYFCETDSYSNSGYPVIKRQRATLDSSGNISMTQLSSSSARIAKQGGSYTYTLASDGALGVSYEGQPTGIGGYVAIGGNVVVMVDTDATDGYISLMVGVRESTSFSASSMVGHSYVLHQTGADYYYDGYSASSWYMNPELGLFSATGSGTGTYTTLCPQYWVNGTTENPSESAEFTGSSDGTFSLIGDDGVGIVSPDGKIIVMSDTNLSSDDWINFTVGVRKTPTGN
ncbi:MAG: hypothetical protein BWY28_00947 [bacterium ADurb.Bin236]|nr:MAG: hypothetical protein BWY28_00947 [bacterium ADurb.Bin236]